MQKKVLAIPPVFPSSKSIALHIFYSWDKYFLSDFYVPKNAFNELLKFEIVCHFIAQPSNVGISFSINCVEAQALCQYLNQTSMGSVILNMKALSGLGTEYLRSDLSTLIPKYHLFFIDFTGKVFDASELEPLFNCLLTELKNAKKQLIVCGVASELFFNLNLNDDAKQARSKIQPFTHFISKSFPGFSIPLTVKKTFT